MKEKEKGKQAGTPAGAMDFLRFIREGHPEWAIIAVKAPIDEVSEEFAEMSGSGAIHRDVQKAQATEFEEFEEIIAVVQARGSAWSIIVRTVFFIDEDHIESFDEEAKDISARLNTRAVFFCGENTSGMDSFKLCEKGKAIEEIEWEENGAFTRFKSTLRKRPPIETVDDSFVDGLFRELGIYVPACYPLSHGGTASLAVDKDSLSQVERADIIEMEDSDEFEDEDEEEED
jgi:hypothetical protein